MFKFSIFIFILNSISVSRGLAVSFDPFDVPSSQWVLDTPPLLSWPLSRGLKEPSMSEPTANTLHDLHADIHDCEMSFNTQGNYHMALEEFWPHYLNAFNQDKPLRNWVYTTTPPMMEKILKNGLVQAGEVEIKCPVQVVVNHMQIIEKFQKNGLIEGTPMPLVESRGDVILVRKGNPKKIRTIWDLGRPGIKVVSAHPEKEASTFKGYNSHILALAKKDTTPPKGMNPNKLFKAIYGNNPKKATYKNAKWLIVNWTHHRGIPWSIAYGHGDAAVLLYHLALDAQKNFPDLFDIVPLGGTIKDPMPIPNSNTKLYLARFKGNWTARQKEASDKLVEMLLSDKFTEILKKYGLMRPAVQTE